MLLATQHRRVSGVFIVLAYRLDKRDLWQASIAETGREVVLILQVLRLRGSAVGELLDVDEGLVVELEGRGVPARASFQPPAYQAQDTPASLSRSPIVGTVCGGIRCAVSTPAWYGW